jgi:hypothetical protein
MNPAPITMRAREGFVFHQLKEALLQTLKALRRSGGGNSKGRRLAPKARGYRSKKEFYAKSF